MLRHPTVRPSLKVIANSPISVSKVRHANNTFYALPPSTGRATRTRFSCLIRFSLLSLLLRRSAMFPDSPSPAPLQPLSCRAEEV